MPPDALPLLETRSSQKLRLAETASREGVGEGTEAGAEAAAEAEAGRAFPSAAAADERASPRASSPRELETVALLLLLLHSDFSMLGGRGRGGGAGTRLQEEVERASDLEDRTEAALPSLEGRWWFWWCREM